MTARRVAVRLWLLLALAAVSPALAQDVPEGAAQDIAEGGAQGLLPVPDYSADFWKRSHLTGDWGGLRATLANEGVQLDVDWTQYLQGDVAGGLDQTTRYGAHFDYLLHLDLMRIGLIPGGMITVRAESRYGHSVNGAVGTILPVNTTAFFPLTAELDENVGIAVTDLNYTQFLSQHFAMFAGKLDTARCRSQRVRLRARQEPVHERELPVRLRGGAAATVQHARGRRAVAPEGKHLDQSEPHQHHRLVDDDRIRRLRRRRLRERGGRRAVSTGRATGRNEPGRSLLVRPGLRQGRRTIDLPAGPGRRRSEGGRHLGHLLERVAIPVGRGSQ